MGISIVVPGKFHYLNYALNDRFINQLDCLYFSSRVGSGFSENSRTKRRNLYAKEYFLRAALRLGPKRFSTHAIIVAHKIWALSLATCFRPSEVNLFLLHGASLGAIEFARKEGGIVIGEAVNMHPLALEELLLKQAEGLGLRPQSVVAASKIVEEVRHCHFILSPAAHVTQSYVDMGFSGRNILTIPYGEYNFPLPEAQPFRKIRHLGQRLNLLCVGQINIRKGQHLLLSALSIARDLTTFDIELTLVGSADYDYFQYLLSRNISFYHVESVPHRRMIDYMSNFDALVLPSVEDGFGLVVSEAKRAGLATLVSKYAGASSLIKENDFGSVIDPFDSIAFAREIVQLTELTELDGSRGTSAPRLWETYAAELSEAITGCLR